MNKCKVFSAAALLVGFSSSAMAASEFYIGAQVGYQDTSVESSAYDNAGYSNVIDGLSADGIAGGVFAGARYYINDNYFIGTEVNLGTSAADHETYASGPGFRYGTELEAGTSYGIAVLAGTQVTSGTALYARLGYQRTEYELTVYDVGYSSESNDETFGGFRYGVGMESDISEQLALRIDWSQTRYSSKDYHDTWGTESFKPTESLFQAGLVFKF